MQNKSIIQTIRFPLSHLPTLFLVIGYAIYWLELYLFRLGHGKTTPLAWLIITIIALIVFFNNYHLLAVGTRNFKIWFLKRQLSVKLLLISMGSVGAIIILCGLYASLLPPHLIQEFDALNYHITLPRQHLISGSFNHISWSTADLYLLPIDFALAPFWLATSLPNKLPQFFFVLGLLGVCVRIASRLSGGKIWPPILLIFAVLGSHSTGIQIGTAMLDIAICYLFLAALDSFLNGAIWLGMIELVFYLWSKPLIPIQFLVTLAIFILAWLFLKAARIRRNSLVLPHPAFPPGKTIGVFLIISLFVAGPFMFKSLRHSATPLFPLGTGTFQSLSAVQSPERWAELKLKSGQLLATKDMYGSGRNFMDFFRHFWLVAVPEKGVNNRYDYPLGLMYLLFLGPFLFLFFSSLRQKILPVISLWVISSWGVWWLGAQQTRFLFIPLFLMYLVVVLSIETPSRVMLVAMLAAALLTSASVYRANRQDFGRWGEAVLRQKDIKLLKMGKDIRSCQTTKLPFYDVAYAAFPVEVIEDNSFFVLRTAL